MGDPFTSESSLHTCNIRLLWFGIHTIRTGGSSVVLNMTSNTPRMRRTPKDCIVLMDTYTKVTAT